MTGRAIDIDALEKDERITGRVGKSIRIVKKVYASKKMQDIEMVERVLGMVGKR